MNKNLWIVTFLTATAWVFIWWILGPQQGGTDIFTFKDAGVNWAYGYGFNAFLIPGNLSLEPKLYFSYPPIYPLIFGLFVKIFGFGAYQNTFFNLLVSMSCSFLWITFLLKIFPKKLMFCEKFIFFMILTLMPIGLLENDGDRPDTLAFSFLIITLILSQKESLISKISSFFVGGVTLMISPFVGVLSLLLLLYLNFLNFLKSIKSAFLYISIFVLPVLIITFCYYIADPSSFERFTNHAMGSGSGAGRILKNLTLVSYANSLNFSATSSRSASLLMFTSSLLFFFFNGILLFLKSRYKNKHLLLLSFLSFLICYAVFPAQNNYLTLSRNFFLLLAVKTIYSNSENNLDFENLKKFAFLLFILIWIFQFPNFLRINYIRFMNKESFHEATLRLKSHKNKFSDNKTTAIISGNLYPLYKNYFRVIDNVCFMSFYKKNEILNSTVKISLVSLDLPPSKQFNSFLEKNKYKLHYARKTNDQPIKLFGKNINSRSFDWDEYVWIKK